MVDGLGSASHVGDFTHTEHTIVGEILGILTIEFVLCGTRQCNIHLLFPWTTAGEECGRGVFLGIGLDNVVAAGTEVEHEVYLLTTDAVGVVDIAVGAADGNHLGTHLRCLGGCAPCHVAKSADGHGLALNGVAGTLEHFAHEVEAAETCCLGTNERASVVKSLACEDTAEVACQTLVLAEEITYLSGSHTDITCRNVYLRTYVAEEFAHEGLAEAHYLAITLASGREVAAALATAHGQGCEGILEGLLKSQELENAEVHAGMETKSTLIGANSAVILDTIAQIDLHFALVVHPGNTECDDALGLDKAFEQRGALPFGVLVIDIFNTDKHFAYCLEILSFSWMLGLQRGHEFFNVQHGE